MAWKKEAKRRSSSVLATEKLHSDLDAGARRQFNDQLLEEERKNGV